MNNIDFVIDNNESITFNTEENKNIVFDSITNDDIDVNIGSNDEEVTMQVNSSNENINFKMKDTPMITNNYNKLVNKPSINSVILIDNKTSEDLGLQPAGSYANSRISNIEIDQLFR